MVGEDSVFKKIHFYLHNEILKELIALSCAQENL